MEKDLFNSSLSDYLIPKTVVTRPISQTPVNTPISECKFMLDSFEKVCHCKDFVEEDTFQECKKVLEEIKTTCNNESKN